MTTHDINLDQLGQRQFKNLREEYENYSVNDDSEIPLLNGSPFQCMNNECKYFMPDDFIQSQIDPQQNVSYFHLNCQGLQVHWDKFCTLMNNLSSDHFTFDYIGVSELHKVHDTHHHIYLATNH